MLPVPDNPDPDLIRQSREGDRDAYLHLAKRHALAVRAIVEARMPGDSRIDEECALAFERIHRTLFVVRELGWFHLFCVRSTQTFFDARNKQGSEPCPPDMPWLHALSASQREALFFALRAEAELPFPAIEYLGISRDAYDARVERGRLALPEPLPEIPDDFIARLLPRIDELLGPRKAKREGLSARLPAMPLGLAFFCVLSLSAVLAGLLFRPVQGRESAPIPRNGKTHVEAGRTTEVMPGIRLTLTKNAIVERKSQGRVHLHEGQLQLELQGKGSFELELGGRLLQAQQGSYQLSVLDGTCQVKTTDGTIRLFRLSKDGQIGAAIETVTANEVRWSVGDDR